MVEDPNEQSNQDKFNLPSLHTRVDDQVSAFIKRGLNLAHEIEASLKDASQPPDLDQLSQFGDQNLGNLNSRREEVTPTSQMSPQEIRTEIQPNLSIQPGIGPGPIDEASWAMVWLRRGIHKYEQVDYAGAKDNFKQALCKEPTLAAAYNGLGSVLYQHRDFVEAIVVYSQALDYAPQNAYIHCNLGSALYQIQNFDESALAYQKAIHFDPYLQGAYFGLGLAQFKIGFQEEAVTAFEQATQLNFRHADSFVGLAAALHALGDYQDATSALIQAMQLSPQYIDVYVRFQKSLHA